LKDISLFKEIFEEDLFEPNLPVAEEVKLEELITLLTGGVELAACADLGKCRERGNDNESPPPTTIHLKNEGLSAFLPFSSSSSFSIL